MKPAWANPPRPGDPIHTLSRRADARRVWARDPATPKLKRRARARRLADRRWTFDELAAEVPESHQPMELWDGELIMAPAPSFFHQEVVGRFHDMLKAWVRPRRLGRTVA